VTEAKNLCRITTTFLMLLANIINFGVAAANKKTGSFHNEPAKP
jgi:hypothetical protein